MRLSIWITAAVFAMGGAVAFAAAFTPGPGAYRALPAGLARWIGNTALGGLCDQKQDAFLRGYARTWSAGYLASFRGTRAPLDDIFFDTTLARCSANRQAVNDRSRAQLDTAILSHSTDDELIAYLRAEPSTGTLLCADRTQSKKTVGARDIAPICAKVFPGAGFAQPAPITVAPAVITSLPPKPHTISAPSRKPPPPRDALKPKPGPGTTPKKSSSPA